jgi:dihydroorotase
MKHTAQHSAAALLLKNGRLIDPLTGTDTRGDLLVVNGIIEQIASSIEPPQGAEVRDCAEMVIAPGFLDMHVHLREPGFEHKETIETGTSAAAAGGFTAVCCMPNTEPAIDDASVVRMIIERSRAIRGGLVDVYPIAAVTRNREGKTLAPLLELAEAGAVGFSDDGYPVMNAEVMRRALEYAAATGRPVIQHAEDVNLTHGGVMNEGLTATRLGMPPMPPAAEDIIVARDIQLAEFTGAPYHVAHISTKGAVDLVRDAKRRKVRVTCEVTPHHFCLSDAAVGSFDTNTKMNPPLRADYDIEAMKQGLKDGTIDAIATDHAPHSYDEKEVEYLAAPFGIVGLETAIGIAVEELVVTRTLSIKELIEKLSTNPRRIVGLPPIRVTKGERANLTIFHPTLQWRVDVSTFKSKSRNSPFHGKTLTGKPVGVVNNATWYFID